MVKKISIVVPAYNAAKYLERCITALMAQNLDDYEIICINDGSTDDTADILERYKSPNFTVISQKNTGVFSARMRGISEAHGEYIAFCDSDDAPAVNWLSAMYARALETNADLPVCGYSRVDLFTQSVICEEMMMSGEINTSTDKLPLLFLNTALWNKLYKAELLKHIYTPLHPPRLAEDALLLAGIYPYVKRVAFVPQSLYSYYVSEVSAMNKITEKDVAETRTAFAELAKRSPMESYQFCTGMAFVSCAVALPLLTESNTRNIMRETYSFLSYNFKGWEKFIGIAYVLRSPYRGKLGKIYVANLCYRLHLFGVLLVAWRLVASRIGKPIKW